MNLFRGWTRSDFAREADSFCVEARASYGLDLDYTPATITALEDMMQSNFEPGSADDNPALIVSMGCYVGEVLIRALGGRWAADDEFFHSPAVIIEGRLQTRTFPLSRVWRRFEYGSEQSLVDYYGEVRRALARVSGLPSRVN